MNLDSIVLTVDIRGGVDQDRLRRSLEIVVAAHDLSGFQISSVLERVSDGHHRWKVGFPPSAVDSGSLTVMFHALAERYKTERVTDEDKVSYLQFTEWRRELEQDHSAPAGRAYWEACLGIGLPEPLLSPQLPFRLARSRPAARTIRASCVQPLDSNTNAGLERLAMKAQVPVDVIFHAAWSVVLARICNQTTFVAGWQHDCRFDYAHFANTVGTFETVFPLVVSVWPDERLSAMLDRHAQILDTARQWQEWWPLDVPHESPYLSVGFSLAHRPAAVDGWSIESWPEPARALELALQIEREGSGKPAQVSMYYATDRFDDASIQALLRQYLSLLNAMPDHLASPIARLPIASDEERGRVLAINAPKSNFGSLAVPDVIALWARKTPQAPALISNERILSYTELSDSIDRLASWLIQQGVRPESPVALCMKRSVDLVIALLAVMRSGGAYLPIDPSWPPARQQQVLSIANCQLVLVDSQPGVSPAPTFPVIQLDQAAYILFTSGSTGEPKGVVVEHGQLLNYVAAVSEALNLSTCRRAALTSTVAADLGNTTLFGALFNGAALIVASDSDMQDAASFARFVRRYEVDCVKMVPSHLAALIDNDAATVPRTVILGGEATPPALVQRIYQLNPDCRLFNHYGPTEATVGVLTHAVDSELSAQTLPLTRSLANTEVFLLDESKQLALTGAVGELFIGGAQICRGYLNKPDATEFVSYPWISKERLYRTGDLGRYLPGGGILLVGRADDQVKIRGFRVELGEIEAALLAQPRVRQAAAQVVGSDSGEIVAYIVLDHSGPLPQVHPFVESLIAALSLVLPAQMVPAAIHVLPELPRLQNGKIDRRALNGLRKPSPQMYVAPRDALEALLANNMATLLGRERLSVTESFLAAGGNSLLVIKLVARIHQQLGLEVPPGIVFDKPTPAALAIALREQEATSGRLEQQAEMLVAH